MTQFVLQATVKRVVLDTVDITVEADNADEADAKVLSALEIYPAPIGEQGISRLWVSHRENLDSEILSIKDQGDEDDGA